MNARTVFRLGLCAFSAWSAGCMSTSLDRAKLQWPEESKSYSVDSKDPSSLPLPLPAVNAEISQVRADTQVPPLPLPKPVPNPSTTLPQQSPPTSMQSPAAPSAANDVPAISAAWLGDGGAMVGPHVRVAPTAIGALLHLGPGELVTDRVVALAQQLDAVGNQNRMLLSRIRELDALAINREQALNEAIREVETATTEVMRSRNELQGLRKELTSFKDRLGQLEAEDVKDLTRIIAAIEKMIAQNPSLGQGGRVIP